jgi:ATP-binding protein involved in chromosome partitioning
MPWPWSSLLMSNNNPTGMVREEAVLQALGSVQDANLSKDIVTLGLIKNVTISGGSVAFDLDLTTPAWPGKETIKEAATAAVKAIDGVESVQVNLITEVRKAFSKVVEGGMKDVKNAVAIASGKGGVGKSTVATNLAIALARSGAKVGLMDADVYGPSVPMMFGKGERPEPSEKPGWFKPAERHGVKFVSMGLFTGHDTPVIWRGPMATKLIQQFLGQVEWGELDYLLIDLPPGTGDVQLTLTQSAPLVGAVVVTTPQDVAVGITMRGLRMFEQVHVPILGIVENMSGFACSHCNEMTNIFQKGGGKRAANEIGVPFLGEIPLDAAIASAGDAGCPIVADDKLIDTAPSARALLEVAGKVAQQISIVQAETSSVKHSPAEVQFEDSGVKIKWADDHASIYAARDLRLACPCAMCIDEVSGEPRLDPATVPMDVKPSELRSVGRYAIQYTWSDGHSTGIYTYDMLRALDSTASQGPPKKQLSKLPMA